MSVETNKQTTVELLTTLYNYDLQLSPNPSSPQLFIVTNDHFLLEFPTDEDLIFIGKWIIQHNIQSMEKIN